MSEKRNGKINPKTGKAMGQRFGREKPAIAGPGRPRLPDEVKAQRALLRQKLEDIAPDAIHLVHEIVNNRDCDDKDRLRAAEIALSHTVPKLEEVTTHDDRPLQHFSDEQLTAKLREIESSRASHPNGNGVSAQ